MAGQSGSGEGVFGRSGGTGSSVSSSRTGVHGVTDSAADSVVWGENAGGGPGVTGTTSSATGPAVHGANTGSGAGVVGECAAGTGVLASGMTALRVRGPAVFSRSGKLTIAAGKRSATKTGVALTSASLVLITPQNDVSGVAMRSAVPNVAAGSFTVHLVKAVSHKVTVGWFVVN